MPNARKGLTLFEFIIVAVIIGVFWGVFFVSISKAAIRAKETALEAELYDLRMSLNLYKEVKGEYPPDLRVLVQARHRFNTSDEVLFGAKFLSAVGLDKDGYPVDPFGKRFYYDHIKGRIYPATKGYEKW